MKFKNHLKGINDYRKLTLRKYSSLINMFFNGISIECLADRYITSDIYNSNNRVLLIGCKYDYSDETSGLAYEYYNFYDVLCQFPGLSVINFDYAFEAKKNGIKKMNEELKQIAQFLNPNVIIYIHFYKLIEDETWKYLNLISKGKTVIWLCDDSWRYHETELLEKNFGLVVTTWKEGFHERVKKGEPCLYLPWGVNTRLYKPYLDFESKKYNITFIGRAHGNRKTVIGDLRKKGVDVKTYGIGWNHSNRINFYDYVDIFNKSKMVLNLTKSSSINASQLKGRDFEVPACKTILVRPIDDVIVDFFKPDKEFIAYKNYDELLEKYIYYLRNPEQAKQIANNGYMRVINEHDMRFRIKEVYNYFSISL